jgi:hypothetical protein
MDVQQQQQQEEGQHDDVVGFFEVFKMGHLSHAEVAALSTEELRSRYSLLVPVSDRTQLQQAQPGGCQLAALPKPGVCPFPPSLLPLAGGQRAGQETSALVVVVVVPAAARLLSREEGVLVVVVVVSSSTAGGRRLLAWTWQGTLWWTRRISRT